MFDQTYDSSFQVEKIVDQKEIAGEPHYLVKWKGYGSDQNTWEPMRHLENSKEKLNEWQLYKKKQINYLEYHKMVDKIQMNEPTKRRQEQLYRPVRSRQKTIFKKQLSKPYQLMPMSASQHSNNKASIFDQVKPKRFLKNQKCERKKKELAIFEERLKSKPKVWQQYLPNQKKITQSCQQIRNVVAQALKYHERNIKKNQEISKNKLYFSQEVLKQLTDLQAKQQRKVRLSSLNKQQKISNKKRKLNKLEQKSKSKTNQNQVQNQKQEIQKNVSSNKYLIVPSSQQQKDKPNPQNINKENQIPKLAQIQAKLNQHVKKFKRSKVNAQTVTIDTINIIQKISDQNFTSNKEQQSKIKEIDNFNQSKLLQVLSKSSSKFKSPQNKIQKQINDKIQGQIIIVQQKIQSPQINQNQRIIDPDVGILSSIKYLSEELSHSVDTISDLQLAQFIRSHQDYYQPVTSDQYKDKGKSLINFASKQQKQVSDKNEKQCQTLNSLEQVQAFGPKKIVRLLTCEGKKYAQVEFEDKQQSEKKLKNISYQQLRKDYSQLLLVYFEEFMLSP